ncbi:hypothetical protein QSU92_00360 [Microbacterium sp. ET2]|uniref:hypothetical protein n=1 Tax=Microbacterium albipurpureum TaxID=3050384 RepID=UPI00259C7CAB|nr:hypothetical protein [Microbacterium sp. ET2 (Ac-2212)]WJL95728.1 hypothetical protein QSU92_00360 [Microbacterium sp. ET2 (Ac-2212)]
MPERLLLADRDAAADALTFAGRAARLGDGAVRLRSSAGTLTMWAAVLAPRGLFDSTPTILGMRAVRADPELECDLVVDATALTADADDDTALALPETALAPSWAGISPPQTGWVPGEEIAASELASRAQWGMAAVANKLPADAGDDVVRVVRSDVWGAPAEELADLPLGVAFAAFGLGFIGGEETVRLFTAPSWTRLSLRRGHVLVRRPPREGLTAVRPTGRADG